MSVAGSARPMSGAVGDAGAAASATTSVVVEARPISSTMRVASTRWMRWESMPVTLADGRQQPVDVLGHTPVGSNGVQRILVGDGGGYGEGGRQRCIVTHPHHLLCPLNLRQNRLRCQSLA